MYDLKIKKYIFDSNLLPYMNCNGNKCKKNILKPHPTYYIKRYLVML